MSSIVPPTKNYPPMPKIMARQHMDVISFYRALIRFCKQYHGCYECPIPDQFCDEIYVDQLDMKSVEEAVEIVESWCAENPQKTNRQKFIEIFGKSPEEVHSARDWLNMPYEDQEG